MRPARPGSTSQNPTTLAEHQRRLNEDLKTLLHPLPPSLTAPVPDGFEPAGDAAPIVNLHVALPVRFFTKTSVDVVPGRLTIQRTTLVRAAEDPPAGATIRAADRAALVDRYSTAAGLVAGDVNGVVSFYRQQGQRLEPLPLDGVWAYLAEIQAQHQVTDEEVATFAKDAITMKGLRAATITMTVIAFNGLSAREKLGRLKAATKALDLKPNEANSAIGPEIYAETVQDAVKKAKTALELRDLLDRLLE